MSTLVVDTPPQPAPPAPSAPPRPTLDTLLLDAECFGPGGAQPPPPPPPRPRRRPAVLAVLVSLCIFIGAALLGHHLSLAAAHPTPSRTPGTGSAASVVVPGGVGPVQTTATPAPTAPNPAPAASGTSAQAPRPAHEVARTSRPVRLRTVRYVTLLAPAAPAPPRYVETFLTGEEAQFLALTNAARASQGLPALAPEPATTAIARSWSAYMASTHLQHNLNLPSQLAAVFGPVAGGENVGYGADVNLLQDAFLASPEHAANIFNPAWRYVGIGVYDLPDGRLYVTLDFVGS